MVPPAGSFEKESFTAHRLTLHRSSNNYNLDGVVGDCSVRHQRKLPVPAVFSPVGIHNRLLRSHPMQSDVIDDEIMVTVIRIPDSHDSAALFMSIILMIVVDSCCHFIGFRSSV